MNKSLSLSLGDLRDFKDVKPIPDTKYYIGYDGHMFNLKPLTAQKPEGLAIIEYKGKLIGANLVTEISHIIDTYRITFDKDEEEYFILPGSYLIEMSLNNDKPWSFNSSTEHNIDAYFTFVDTAGNKQVFSVTTEDINKHVRPASISRLLVITKRSKIRFNILHTRRKTVWQANLVITNLKNTVTTYVSDISNIYE